VILASRDRFDIMLSRSRPAFQALRLGIQGIELKNTDCKLLRRTILAAGVQRINFLLQLLDALFKEQCLAKALFLGDARGFLPSKEADLLFLGSNLATHTLDALVHHTPLVRHVEVRRHVVENLFHPAITQFGLAQLIQLVRQDLLGAKVGNPEIDLVAALFQRAPFLDGCHQDRNLLLNPNAILLLQLCQPFRELILARA
jgi:hypothetical protein